MVSVLRRRAVGHGGGAQPVRHLLPLTGIHSSATDIYPNTATLTFHDTTYTSKYLVFAPVENQDVNHNLLQSPTAAQQAIWNKFDPSNGYPFIDIGNQFIAGPPPTAPRCCKA